MAAAATLLAITPARAQPTPSPTPGTAFPVHIQLLSLQPRAVRPHDTIVVTARITNAGRDVLHEVGVRLRLTHRVVTSRSELAQQASDTSSFGYLVFVPGSPPPLSSLRPGQHADVTIRLPVADVAVTLSQSGVYPFGIEVEAGDIPVGRVRTFLPYIDPSEHTPVLTLAWLWPLVAPPARDPAGAFVNDQLAGELAPTGRLGRLLDTAAALRNPPTPRPAKRAKPAPGTPLPALPQRAVPVTLAVDPALLESVAAMAAPARYVVRPPGGSARQGAGSAAAGAFLARLRELAAADPVLALPYADPDIVALVRAGLADDVRAAENQRTQATGTDLTQGIIGTAPLVGYAWPPDGLVTGPALDSLVTSGVDTVVLSGDAVPANPALTYTPNAATVLPTAAGGSVRALVSDPGLDGLVSAPPPGGFPLAEQRFLAETMLIAEETPARPRTLVVTVPHLWQPDPNYAAALLADTGRVPWLTGTTVNHIAPATTGGGEREALTYPASHRSRELPAGLLHALAATEVSLATLDAILDTHSLALERAALRAESAAWRTDPRTGQLLVDQISAEVDGLRGKVRILSGGSVSLASRTSKIPVTVANQLSQPVHVRVDLSTNSARLAATDPGVRTIPPGHTAQVEIGVRAQSSGVFPAYVRLLTPAGQPYGPAVKLVVRSTAYGALALAITGGAFGVLLLTVAVRLGRRIWRARGTA
jgi:hypothetical protein